MHIPLNLFDIFLKIYRKLSIADFQIIRKQKTADRINQSTVLDSFAVSI